MAQQAILTKNFEIDEAIKDSIKLVESIKNYIKENDCPDLSMDISSLNIIDASKITILCSTYHWAKYPDGSVSWLINSDEIRELVKPLNLGNINLVTVQ
jgi:anti-anti-sigma regulatory factor